MSCGRSPSCGVLVAHIVKVGLKLTDHPMIDELGQFGVLVFFVHTSTVLLMSLDRTPAAERWGPFYIRRAFRVYPLAIATIGLNALLLSGRGMISLGDLISNLRDPRVRRRCFEPVRGS